MGFWPSTRARHVRSALLRIVWRVNRQRGSHATLERDGWSEYTWSFHDDVEIGPVMLARIARTTGLTPTDL